MVALHPIDSLDLPELAPYRSMRLQETQRREGVFVAEGDKVVRRLLKHPHLRVISMLLPPERLGDFQALAATRAENIRVYLAPKPLLEQLTGYPLYQGVLALGQVPTPPTLDAVLTASRRPYLLAAVDGITSAQNLGVLVRNIAALGAQALLVGSTSSSPYLRRAVRSSMGGVFQISVVEPVDLAPCLRHLRDHGIRCLAAHPPAQQRVLSQADLTADCCIVFGHEGCGISPAVLEACNEAICVPMQAGLDSLNVGSAAAVFFYEAMRQRRFAKPPEPTLDELQACPDPDAG